MREKCQTHSPTWWSSRRAWSSQGRGPGISPGQTASGPRFKGSCDIERVPGASGDPTPHTIIFTTANIWRGVSAVLLLPLGAQIGSGRGGGGGRLKHAGPPGWQMADRNTVHMGGCGGWRNSKVVYGSQEHAGSQERFLLAFEIAHTHTQTHARLHNQCHL